MSLLDRLLKHKEEHRLLEKIRKEQVERERRLEMLRLVVLTRLNRDND